MPYTAQEILSLAKRIRNAKRSYLLVNPLQGKHMPVSPSVSLSMMAELGDQIARAYPAARLVIGFAETATAIGAHVARALGPDCVYLQTTREKALSGGKNLIFEEEHSHAVEQLLCAERLDDFLKNTSHVIFVDDELSTGKTLINIIRQIQSAFPAMAGCQAVAASLINRLSPENMERLKAAGVESQWLVKLEEEDYSALVDSIPAEEASAAPADGTPVPFTPSKTRLINPRLGCTVREQEENLQLFHREWLDQLRPRLAGVHSLLVLGTEECMYPAITLGAAIQQAFPAMAVRTHSTTRSPIGICRQENYPITSGFRLNSLYEAGRTTHLYNLSSYDLVIIVTDAPCPDPQGTAELIALLKAAGNEQIFLLGGALA